MRPRTRLAALVESYFVGATPRTGSSLLLGLLDSTGVCGHPQAYFRAPDEASWAARWSLSPTAGHRAFVAAAMRAGRTPNGVFGAKLMWGTHAELVAKLAPARSGDDLAVLREAFGVIRFVCLRRDDVLAQAVSWVRAEQTGRWFDGGHGEISGAGPAAEPVFDAAAITRTMRTIEEHNAGWEAWFARYRVEPLRVRYEDLAADPTGTTRRVLHFLGVAAPGRIVAHHRRQADELNREWIRRYQAAAIAGS